MPKNSIEILYHIKDECNYLIELLNDDLTKDKLLNDQNLKRAVVRSLEIIGEASKKISADEKLIWKNIPWKNMTGMRDRLIHDYFGVNYSIVWDVIKNKIPDIYTEIQTIIEDSKIKE